MAVGLIAVGLPTSVLGGFSVAGIDLKLWGGAVLLSGVIVLVVSFVNAGTRYVVFEKGLVKLVPALPPTVIRWAELRELWHKVTLRYILLPAPTLSYTLKLVSHDGTALVIRGDIGEVSALEAVVWTQTLLALMPAALKQLERGRALEFRKFRITLSHISARGEDVSWDVVERVQIQAGVVAIKVRRHGQATDWLRVRAPDIPNLPVLMALLGDGGPFQKLAQPVNLARISFFNLGG